MKKFIRSFKIKLRSRYIKKHSLFFLLITLFFLSACGKVVSNLEYSTVKGQDLRWGRQLSINLSNLSSYSLTGQCVGVITTNVAVDIGNPPIMQINLPCIDNRFISTVDLSSAGLVNGPLELIASQVGVPFQAIGTVIVGTVPPPIPLILTPLNGSTLITSNQTLTGTCQAGSIVYILGDILTPPLTTICDLLGNYTIPISLIPTNGPKTISVYQEDIVGNVSPTVNSNVTLILPPLAPVITAPVNNLNTRFVAQTIIGTCEPGALVSVNSGVNAAPVTSICSVGSSFSIAVSLIAGDGSKVINVNQTNVAGTSANATVNLNLDTTPPVAPTITSPTDTGLVNLLAQTVAGACEANSTVTVSGSLVTSVIVVCPLTNNYSALVSLTAGDGIKTISALQTDAAGNISPSSNITVTLDQTQPTILISSPSPDPTTITPIAFTITFSENVTGFVSGDISVTNGSILSFAGGPLVYNVTVNPVLLGPVTLTIAAGVAIDSANNLNQTGTFSLSYGPAMTLSVANATTVDIALATLGNVVWDIDWGDGTQTLNRTSNILSLASKTYSGSFTGQVRVYGIQPTDILQLAHNTGRWSYDLSALPTTLTTYDNRSTTNIVTGNISGLPSSLTFFRLVGQNTTTGDIANLPASLIYFTNQGRNTTFGNIGGLPAGLQLYGNFGLNTTTGDIATLPVGLTDYGNYGSNTTFGNLMNLPANLVTYANQGSNTVTGDIATMPSTVTSFRSWGLNTIFGNVASLPAGMTEFSVDPFGAGLNTTTGTFASLKPGLITYLNGGLNTVTGAFADLPDSLVNFTHRGASQITGGFAGIKPSLANIEVTGSNTFNDDIANLPGTVVSLILTNANTVFGNITNIPASVTNFNVAGSNTLTGDINDLKPTLTRFILQGNNTISGDISNLEPALTVFEIQGSNTVTGNIAALPVAMRSFLAYGSNTTSGSINALPATIRRYQNRGLNTTTATGTAFAPTAFELFDLNHNGTIRSQSEINNILITLSSVIAWTSERRVDVRGVGNATPGPAGLAARTVLITNGVTVNNN